MAPSTNDSKDKAAALRRLRTVAKEQPVTAQVFLSEDVAEAKIAELAQDIVRPMDAKLGKIHGMAKSFSVTAKPEVLEKIAGFPDVRSVIPNQVDDIFPKPVRKKRL